MVQTCNAFLSAWLGAVRLGQCWGAAGRLGARDTRVLRCRARAVVRRVGGAWAAEGRCCRHQTSLPLPHFRVTLCCAGALRYLLCLEPLVG